MKNPLVSVRVPMNTPVRSPKYRTRACGNTLPSASRKTPSTDTTCSGWCQEIFRAFVSPATKAGKGT